MPQRPYVANSGVEAPAYRPTDAEIAEIARKARPDDYAKYVQQYGNNQQLFDAQWGSFAKGQYEGQIKNVPTSPGWPDKQVNTDPAWIQATVPYEQQYLTGLKEQGYNVDPRAATGTGNPVQQGDYLDSSVSRILPGVTIDQTAYADTAAEANDQQRARDLAIELAGRDANRNAIDPSTTPMVIGAAPVVSRGVSTRATDTDGAFFETERDVRQAEDIVKGILTNTGGMQSAAEMAGAAARGETPSAAAAMYERAGAQTANQYNQIALDSQQRARSDAASLRAMQAALAAGQRGAVSGAANLQAMNNSALAESRIKQEALDASARAQSAAIAAGQDASYQAAAARASEMASSRELYARIQEALRQGDIATAQQLAALAATQQRAESEVLGVEAANTAAHNQGQQFNSSQDFQAQTFNNSQENDIRTDNANRKTGVMQGNQSAAITTGNADTAAVLDAQGTVLNESARDRDARIALERDYGGQVFDNADRAAGYTDYLDRRGDIARAGAERDQARQDQRTAGYLNAGGAVVTAGISGLANTDSEDLQSDERTKNIKGPSGTPDFRGAAPRSQSDLAKQSLNYTRARDSRYTYKGDPTRTEYRGPMAQQLPVNVRTKGPGGVEFVNQKRLAMNLASAVGRLQQKVGV